MSNNFFGSRAARAAERKDFVVLDGDKLVEFTVREREGVRGITLSVNHSRGLVATIPPRTPPGELTAFLLKKEKWILAKLDYYANFPKPSRFDALAEAGEARVRFLGVDYALEVKPCDPPRLKTVFDEKKGVVTVFAPSPRVVRRALASWYRKQAERVFAARVALYAGEMGLRARRVFIRSQRTAFGTCSALHNLSFNWRLVLAPLDVVDYVVVHELAHLRELNHSKEFWRLVQRYCPNYREKRKWLREHERELAF
ncbi:MAG: SprT family zinc-dependent metalloprotease [Candidatus Norongarragalinales archaeon]